MEGRNHSEVARLAGIDQSLVSRWRSGHPPTRLQERTRKRLVALIGSTPARDASETSAAAAESEITKYALSTLRMIQRQAQAIVDNAAEAQRVLGGAPTAATSPSIDEAEEEAAVLDQELARSRPEHPRSKRRPA